METAIQHAVLLPRSAEILRLEQNFSRSGLGNPFLAWACPVVCAAAILLFCRGIWVEIGMAFVTTAFAYLMLRDLRILYSAIRYRQNPFLSLAEDANERFQIFNRTADVLSAYAKNVSSGIIRATATEDAIVADLIAEGEALRAYALRLEKLFEDESVSPLIAQRIVSEYARDLREIEQRPRANFNRVLDEMKLASVHPTNG